MPYFIPFQKKTKLNVILTFIEGFNFHFMIHIKNLLSNPKQKYYLYPENAQ